MNHNINYLLAAEHQCMFGAGPHDFCGQLAVLHVWAHSFGPDPKEPHIFTMSCETHAVWWETNPYIDKHTIDADCGMPNTIWCWNGDPEMISHCHVDGEKCDHPLIEETIETPELVGATS